MRGHAYLTKDGSPSDLYAPAEGLLGPYGWYPDHLRSVHALGQVFPKWRKPWGSKGAITKAAELLPAVAEKADVGAALKALLTLPPLSLTDAEIREINVQGHSAHATPPEWARAIDANPFFADVPSHTQSREGLGTCPSPMLCGWDWGLSPRPYRPDWGLLLSSSLGNYMAL